LTLRSTDELMYSRRRRRDDEGACGVVRREEVELESGDGRALRKGVHGLEVAFLRAEEVVLGVKKSLVDHSIARAEENLARARPMRAPEQRRPVPGDALEDHLEALELARLGPATEEVPRLALYGRNEQVPA
jgi:hypothetical protein